MKRIFTFVLAIVLLVTAVPVSTVPVSATPAEEMLEPLAETANRAENRSFSTAEPMEGNRVGDEYVIDGLYDNESQWFRVYAEAGDWLYAAIYGIYASEDWDLGLYNSSNSQITYSARYGSLEEYIGYTVPYSDYYYFKVQGFTIEGRESGSKFKVVISGGTQGSASTNSGFNRPQTWSYLCAYYNTFNPDYPEFAGDGGDCANFVSQALVAGGMTMRGNANNRGEPEAWFMDTGLPGGGTGMGSWTTDNYSATWTNANSFTTHWGTNSYGSGYERAYECKYYTGRDVLENFSELQNTLKVGDVIQLTRDPDTERYHTLMVYDVTGDDILLACHSIASCDRSLKEQAELSPGSMITVIRIKNGV